MTRNVGCKTFMQRLIKYGIVTNDLWWWSFAIPTGRRRGIGIIVFRSNGATQDGGAA